MTDVRLGDVLVPRREVVHPRDNPRGEALFVGLEHVESNTGRRIGGLEVRLEELSGRKPRFHAGDIVYGYLRPYLNKVWVADRPGLCSVDQYVFEVRDAADPEFVAAYLRSPMFLARAPVDETPGQLPRIRIDEVLGVAIDLPALPEQRRIVAGLRGQFAAVDRATEANAASAHTATAFRIKQMRSTIPIPPTGPWPWIPLSDAAEFLDSIRRPISGVERATRTNGRAPQELYPYYGANGQAGWIDDFLFDEPLVLLAEDGGAFGSIDRPIAYRIDGRSWVNNHAHVLRPRAGMDIEFLALALAVRPDIGNLVSGSTRGKLNQRIAASIPIPAPPFIEQRQVVERWKSREDSISSISAAIDLRSAMLQAMPRSILDRTFVGIGDAARLPSSASSR